MSTATSSPFYSLHQALPKRFWDYVVLAVLLAFMLFFLMPVYVMVVTGLKEARNVSLSTMWNLPQQLSGGGFVEAWQAPAGAEPWQQSYVGYPGDDTLCSLGID